MIIRVTQLIGFGSRGFIAAAPSAPANTAVPVISGTTTEGSTLSTTDGTWTGSPTPSYAYQWKRGGANIGGATASTYLLVTADIAATITVTVTATNAGGSASATSTGVGPVTGLASYVTWDPATVTAVTLSGGNLAATNTGTTSADQGARVASASGKTTGKYYFEAKLTTSTIGGNRGVGIGTSASTYTGLGNNGTTGIMTFVAGSTWSMGSSIHTWSSWSVNVWHSFAFDLDTRKYWWRVASGGNWNNAAIGSQNPAVGSQVGGLTIPAGTMVPFVTFGGTAGAANNVITANFGATAFTGTVPSGFTSGWPA